MGVNVGCTLLGIWLIATGASRMKRREKDDSQGTTLDLTRRRNALRRLQRRVFGGMVLNVISLAGWIYLLVGN